MLAEVVVEVGLEIAAPEVLLERLLVLDCERVDKRGAFGGEVLERLLCEGLDLGVSGWRVDVGAVDADARAAQAVANERFRVVDVGAMGVE